MIDIYAMYRKAPEANKRPFNRFFESAGFVKAFDHLRYAEGIPERDILRRTRGTVAAPATALAHTLIALEFVRWMDYGKFVSLLDLEKYDVAASTHQ